MLHSAATVPLRFGRAFFVEAKSQRGRFIFCFFLFREKIFIELL